LVAVGFVLAEVAAQGNPNRVIAQFEGDTYGEWTAEGTAFGTGPAKGTLPGQMRVSGYVGKGLVNSFNGGDRATGRLTSPPFTIDRTYISFLIGGGGWREKTCMNLLVDGKIVRTAAGPNVVPGGSEELEPGSWDVSDLLGKQAQIQIVDNEQGGWGHINVDQIVACDNPPPQPLKNVTREVTADKRWLLLPVKNGGQKCKVEVRAGAEVLRFFDIELAEGEPDWWAPLDLWNVGQTSASVLASEGTGGDACPTALRGKTLTLWADKLPAGSKGLERVRFAEVALPKEGLYREALRPQLHFSPARGWNNDPNGLVFFKGEYHLFFQHNPYGVNWGNMHWGHAVSKDLVHWTEVEEALYPDALGPMFSGSAVVDHANTSGFGKDGRPPLVLIYTAAGNPATQCIATSLDGRSFAKYDGNPVVKNITGGNRDPKVFWHAPTGRWIMALYVGKPEKLHTVQLLASTNLREWTELSAVPGDKGGGRYLYECPDFFELPCRTGVPACPAGVTGGDACPTKWVLFGADGQYALGAFDGQAFKPEAERLKGHCGTATYAAQTFSDLPDGRRVLIGWLRAPSPGMPFNQGMTLPQELGLVCTPEGVRLTHAPVKELAALRERTQSFGPADLAAGGTNPLAGFEAELVELRVSCEVSAAAAVTIDLRGVPLRYDAAKQELTIAKHQAPWPVKDGKLGLIIYLDRTCVEVFSQDGLLYAPVAVIPDASAKGVSLEVEKGSVRGLSGAAHALRSCWK
jgi:sucrose-6-phosphate hydrolase SacC (GH32 family)